MGKPRILLVEDNDDDVELAVEALGGVDSPYDIVIAKDGAQALQYLQGPMELPDLVLLDLKLPKVTGIEVLAEIRAHPQTRRLVVVVLTSSDHDTDLARCYDLGANSYVNKPLDFGKFRDTIGTLGHYWLQINRTA